MKEVPSVLIFKSDLQKENNLLDIIDRYYLNLFVQAIVLCIPYNFLSLIFIIHDEL